uniref:chitin synthase n=1 Tax=Haemonchus contortus TaxID=6289 RepID=A0A7I4YIE4_HAECO
MSSNDDDYRWNVFRSHKRAATETPSLTPWMITSLQATKLLLFLMCNTFLTLGSAISKICVLILATNIWDRKYHTDPYARRCSRIPVQRTPRGVAAMYLALLFIQAVPDVVAIIRSLMRFYGGDRAGRIRLVFVVLEFLRALGLSLLIFTVFPQLDLYRCLCLCACFPIITALQQLLSTISRTFKPGRSFGARMFLSTTTLPHLILFLALFSATYLWNVMETPFHGAWVLPFGLFAISIGFWESWVSENHAETTFHELYQVKYGLRKLNISTRLMIAIVRIITVLVVMIYAAKGRVKPYLFFNVLTSYSYSFRQTRLLLIAFGMILLNFSLRGCARFLAAIGMRAFSVFHPVTIVPAVGYAIIAFICNHKICGIANFLARLGLRWSCDQWGRKTRPFDDWYICMIWLAVGAYRGYQFVHQKSYDKSDEVVDSMPPVPNGFCIEQSLVVFHISLSKAEPTFDIDDDHGDPYDELIVRNDEVDRTVTLYMCATMWHETATEMAQMLRSILKLDGEHARRLATKKADQLRFRLEGHIFFDDAWEDRTELGITKRVPNDFFRTFFDTLSELTGEFVDESGSMMSRILVNTPYGGRLVVKLPAGTLLFVHLKDKKLIRHKKRWSQVMYMYYLLGHRIMDSPLSIEDRQQMADNTFILAIDGDSKFEPEAVMRLLNLMNTKSDIGCACGRIHPIGSGVMVWYQKFEYAIAHWFQKAAEHVFGCVLCAPGCFSLFRASALMDDNIMHKYTKTAQEPRHFVQYDQGEDRWLSTLMLKQGYRIEYVAASDAETYAPEGFEEFFNQRRRWTPSSIANTIDLLSDYKRASENNDSISMSYISYQFMVIFFSMLGPAIIFTMLVFAQVAAFGVDSAKVMLYNGIPISLFIVICFITESNVQLLYAKLMSIIYAFVMLAVLVATSSQIVLETVISPTSMFIVAMVLIFFIAACLHPREFTNIIYGIVFFLMIPSTYVFLSLYSLINLNVINWGTREAVAKATGKVETTSTFERWLRRIGESSWSALCPTLRARPDEGMQLIERKLERLERSVAELHKNDEDNEKAKERLLKIAKDMDDAAGTSDIVEIRRPIVEAKPVRSMDKYMWMEGDYLQVCERGRLKAAEEEFWIQLIETYLKPIESSPQQQSAIAEGLASLRNNIAFSIILLNALLALAIYLIQKHKNVLSIRWTPYRNFKWTKMNELTGQYEETKDPLKIDPLGMAIIVFLLGILIVQTIGMLIHRLNTMIGAFQEVNQFHDLVPNWKSKKTDDERILTAARQMTDTTSYALSHGADGYTRHRELDRDNETVLYKLQRARLAKRMQKAEAKNQA